MPKQLVYALDAEKPSLDETPRRLERNSVKFVEAVNKPLKYGLKANAVVNVDAFYLLQEKLLTDCVEVLSLATPQATRSLSQATYKAKTGAMFRASPPSSPCRRPCPSLMLARFPGVK